jgi:hypothetical protein
VSELEQLKALEQRLDREQINLLIEMARQSWEHPLAVGDLGRVANIHSALDAVRAEIAARLPREGFTP